jgi:hypothetical protein
MLGRGVPDRIVNSKVLRHPNSSIRVANIHHAPRDGSVPGCVCIYLLRLAAMIYPS